VFIVKPTTSQADFRFRFMTATTEVDSCGHATLAGAKAIYEQQPFDKISIETGAGIITVYKSYQGLFMIKMAKSEIGDVEYEKPEIARLLRIKPKDILNFPVKTASVGSPKLMIPIKSLQIVESVEPDYK